jgi:putative ABC transport system permease protein
MRTLGQDIRYAARLLRRSPGFSAIAIAALAIGIGANTAIFSVVDTLLLQHLPYADPDRLAIVWEHNIPRDRKSNVVSPGNFVHWREMNASFVDLAAASVAFNMTLTGVSDPEEIRAQLVSAQFFPLLGVAPVLGRTFTAEEDRRDSRIIVISDRLWRQRFSADRSIVGKPITLGGVPYTVVGVAPSGVSLLDKTIDLWRPIGFTAEDRTPQGRGVTVVGRLKPDVSFARAHDDMVRVHAELTRMFPRMNTGWTARVVPLKEQLFGDVRPSLFVLLAAVAFVLLIACANVANLLLARATSRRRELAVRAALGANRGRLIRQLLAECLVLASAGGAAGLLLAYWMIHVLRTVVAARLPIQRLELVAIDGRVLAFTIAASVLSGLVFGVFPAFAGSAGLNEALKEGGRTGSAAKGNRARSVFVIVEVALAVVLLVGAGLLLRSFTRLLDISPGFDPHRTVTLRVSLPEARYDSDAKKIQFFQRLFQKTDALPGVQAAGSISALPLTGPAAATRFEIVGKPAPPLGQEPVADVRVVSHGYFRAMGVPLLRGRLFNEDDPADAANRVIINDTMARRHWPGEDPIGKRVRISWSDRREDEVIGVVGDVRQAALDVEPRATTYWPYARNVYGGMTLAIRTSHDERAIVSSVSTLIRQEDPLLAVSAVHTLDEVIAASVAQRRLLMMLLSIFAGAALLLAAVGIYGVIAYSVTQRTQEIGIRLALGAQQATVLRLVIGQALALALAGVVIGGAGALALTRTMQGLLFAVRPTDPATFLSVALGLTVVALIASYIPARRAMRVDPVIALRAE